MKKILALLILQCIFLAPSQSQWQIISAGDLDPIGDTLLRDIFFLNRDTGYITGGEVHLHGGAGSIFKTNDGGESWETVYHSSFFSPGQIQFTNESTAYFNTYGGWNYRSSLFRSTDGGENWHEILDLVSGGFSFVSEEIGFVINWENLLKTSTAGNTWDTIYNGCNDTDCYYFTSSFFLNEELGWLITDSEILLRYNAPDTWQEISLKDIDFPNKILFTDENRGWITSGYHYNETDYHFGFYKTIDGGISWDSVPGIDFLINDICFENDSHAWAVGKDVNGQGLIKESNDQGITWTTVIDKLPGGLNRIIEKNGQLWAIGEHGLILKYSNSPYWVNSAELENNPPYLVPGEGIVSIKTEISNPESYPLIVKAMIESTDGETEVIQAMNNSGGDLWATSWLATDNESFFKVRLVVERSDISGSSFSYSMGIPFTTAGPIEVLKLNYSWYEGYMTDTIPNPGDTIMLKLDIVNRGISDTVHSVGMKISANNDLITTLWGSYIDSWRPLAAGDTIFLEFPIIISSEAEPGSLIPVEVNFYSQNRYYWKDTFYVALEGYDSMPQHEEAAISIFPNPAGDHINLIQERNVSNQVLVEIFDLSGTRIIQRKLIFSGREIKELNVSELDPGIYILNIKGKGLNYQLKVLKL